MRHGAQGFIGRGENFWREACSRDWDGYPCPEEDIQGIMHVAVEEEAAEMLEPRVEACGIPIRYRRATLDEMDVSNKNVQRMVERATAYVKEEHWKNGLGLYISGPPGVGKTHVAAAIMIELIRLGVWPCSFWSVPDLLNDVRASYREKSKQEDEGDDAFDDALMCEILVLDDIGTERQSEWVREILYAIIDYRYSNMLPTIYTSNYPLARLRDLLDPEIDGKHAAKLTGRIYQTCAPPIWVDAPDYRLAGRSSRHNRG